MDPIQLDLSVHCIETEIKRIYNKLLSKVFKEDRNEGIENQIEILKHSLENFDFSRLRSTYPELAGGIESRVSIHCDPKGQPAIEINGKAIPGGFVRKKPPGKYESR